MEEPDLQGLRDQFAPFEMGCFGSAGLIDGQLRAREAGQRGEPFNGTLFRFPLRTEANAAWFGRGKGISAAYSMEKVRQQFEEFQQSAEEKLLFFQHVRHIELWEWYAGAAEPVQLHSVSLRGAEAGERGRLSTWLRENLDQHEQKTGEPWQSTPGSTMAMLRAVQRKTIPRDTWQLYISVIDSKSGVSREEEWWCRAGVGLADAWRAATKDDRDGELTLWPAAAVAARVHSRCTCEECSRGGPCSRSPDQQKREAQRLGLFAGKAFATLPTKEKTGFPVHINARWKLTNNRHSLKSGKDKSDQVQAQWNQALIRDAAASLWSELLVQLSRRQPTLPTTTFYSLWPKRSLDGTTFGVQPGSDWDQIIDPLYCTLSTCKVLRVRDPSFSLSLLPGACPAAGTWTSISEGGVWDSLLEVPTTGARLQVRSAWLVMILRKDIQRSILEAGYIQASRSGGKRLVRGNSARSPCEVNGNPKWKRMVRNLCSFLRESGNISNTLVMDGFGRLLETPGSILQQFAAVAQSLSSSKKTKDKIGSTGEARAVTADDVRTFYRGRAVGFERAVLEQAPFPGLRGSAEAWGADRADAQSQAEKTVCGALRCCIADLVPGEEAAGQLLGLPLLLLASDELVRFSEDGPAQHIVAGPSVLGYILLGRRFRHFVHPLMAPILRQWVAEPGAAARLKLAQLTATVLAEHLGAVLPDWWQGNSAVPWTPGADTSGPSSQWMDSFWRFLRSDKCTDLTPFDSWPLIPCRMRSPDNPNGESVLVSCRNRKCILRIRQEKVQNQIVPEKLSGRAKKVFDMFARIGVPTLSVAGVNSADDATTVMASELQLTELGIGCFDPHVALQVLDTCNENMAVSLDHLQPDERELLLGYWQNADLNPAELEILKKLPLFEIEGSRSRVFVPITQPGGDQRTWYMLPEDIPRNELRGEFLKHVAFTDLYASLGVEPLSREKFYCEFIFPDIQAGKIGREDTGRHLHDIHLNFEQLLVKMPRFADELAALKFVETKGGEMVVPGAAFDPEERLFQQFFPNQVALAENPLGWRVAALALTSSGQQLPSTMTSRRGSDWLDFLRKVGMITSFSRAVFLKLALEISTDAEKIAEVGDQDLANYIRPRAEQLSRYLIENVKAFKDEPGDAAAFFDQVSQLRLAVPILPPVGVDATAPCVAEAARAVLIPWRGALRCERVERNVAWSQVPAVKMPTRGNAAYYYINVEFCINNRIHSVSGFFRAD